MSKPQHNSETRTRLEAMNKAFDKGTFTSPNKHKNGKEATRNFDDISDDVVVYAGHKDIKHE